MAGRAFGRTLVSTTLERRAWIGTVKSLRVGFSLFVDGAKPWSPFRSVEVPWQLDGGAGIRLAGIGSRGEFRIMAAHGIEDGKSALSMGWEIR